MTIAEKHVRHYNQLNGGKHSRADLVQFHARLKKDIDSKKIDTHMQYGIECVEIEKRLARALPKAAAKVTVICDKPVRIKKAKVIIKHTDRGPEVVKKKPVTKNSKPVKVTKVKRVMIVDDRMDMSFIHGLACNPPEAESEGLGFTKDGQQKIYEMVNSMILETMKSDGLFWRIPWKERKGLLSPGVLAENFSTHKPYRGINYVILNYYANIKRGHESPYYLTFKQAEAMGGKIRKGAKSLPVFYYNLSYFITKPERKRISEEQAKAMTEEQQAANGMITIPVIQYYSVFNSEDIEGIKFPDLPKGTPHEGIETAEKIVEGMPKRPKIEHSNKTSAYYSPSEDYVHMPKLEWFEKPQEYYSALFHELIHSTGHQSRVNRKFGIDKEGYAYEELIAEIGASYLCAEAGVLYFTLKNSAAYIKGWKEKVNAAVKADPKFFLKVSAKAQKAADFILDRSEDSAASSKDKTSYARSRNNKPAAVKMKRTMPSTIAKPENKLKGLGFTSADTSKLPSQRTRLPGAIGDFLQDLQFYKLVIMVSGETHSSKSELGKQIADAFISAGHDVAWIDWEQGGLDSDDTVKSINRNVKPENKKRLHVDGDFPRTLEALKDLAKHCKVIALDSGSKIEGNSNAWIDELRNECPNTVWIILMQQNEKGGTRGGVSAEFDVPVLIKTYRADENDYTKNYAYLYKNRGNKTGLYYMMAEKKIWNSEPQTINS